MILKESIRVNGNDSNDSTASIDTTLQEKNITFPTDSKLVNRYFDSLVDYGEVPTKKIIECLSDKCLPEDDSLEDDCVNSPDYYQVTTEQPIQIMWELMSNDEFTGHQFLNRITEKQYRKRRGEK